MIIYTVVLTLIDVFYYVYPYSIIITSICVILNKKFQEMVFVFMFIKKKTIDSFVSSNSVNYTKMDVQYFYNYFFNINI